MKNNLDIAFYQLRTAPLERALPKLLEKIYASSLRAVVVCDSVEHLTTINSVLWTYHPGAFLPHGFEGDPMDQPIWLSLEATNLNQADVLIITNAKTIPENSSYKRHLDIFDGNNPENVNAARNRYKKYLSEGHSLTFWKQKEDGNWEK